MVGEVLVGVGLVLYVDWARRRLRAQPEVLVLRLLGVRPVARLWWPGGSPFEWWWGSR